MYNNINTQKIILDEIGEILLNHSNRAQNIRITINGRGQIRVTIPPLVKIEQVLEFVVSKKNWIIKNQKKLKEKKILKLRLSDDELKIFWKKTKLLTDQLSQKHNLHYKQLIFKTLKSRWGSCSVNNVICLNNLLYYLPKHLAVYVIIHELMHTEIKNHSKYFWGTLEHIYKDAKLHRKELRDNYILG